MPIEAGQTGSLREWIGRSETVTDTVSATPFAALAATFDQPQPADGYRPAPGTPLPGLWHWLYFLPLHAQSDIGSDGHARRGGFLPPVPQPRRMWAGGDFEFHESLCIGDVVSRTSTVVDVQEKTGRSGGLVFVRLRHEIRRDGSHRVALTEHQQLVYRAAPVPGDVAPAPQPAPTRSVWARQIQADEVLLFRYSALTFNGHRIHFDRHYATETEGYAGLVVHGPLIATLLLELVRTHAPRATVSRFEFRAVRPTLDIHPFSVHGDPADDGKSVHLWCSQGGCLTMHAAATLA